MLSVYRIRYYCKVIEHAKKHESDVAKPIWSSGTESSLKVPSKNLKAIPYTMVGFARIDAPEDSVVHKNR